MPTPREQQHPNGLCTIIFKTVENDRPTVVMAREDELPAAFGEMLAWMRAREAQWLRIRSNDLDDAGVEVNVVEWSAPGAIGFKRNALGNRQVEENMESIIKTAGFGFVIFDGGEVVALENPASEKITRAPGVKTVTLSAPLQPLFDDPSIQRAAERMKELDG